MFSLAILIGIYSYLIFFLGINGLLFKNFVFTTSLVYIVLAFFFFRSKILKSLNAAKNFIISKDKLSLFLAILIITQLGVNFIGVLGPEISFDALWYHLTLPKLYILQHEIFHIQGNLLYYSDMPKLTEMLYLSGLIFGNEIVAKLVHFSFGVLTLIAIYRLSRKYFSKNLSLLSSIVFYSSLVVGWESITAYVDLARTFFEIMAFWGFVNWIEKNEKKWLVISGVMLGFAATAKLVAYGSLFIFLALFAYNSRLKKDKLWVLTKNFTLFCFFSILISIPWLVFSFANTGNPFYPYFTNAVVDSGRIFVLPNTSFILKDLYAFFLNLNDPISPIYLIVIPLIIVNFKSYSPRAKELLIYTFISIAIWYLALGNRGGRFIMPYLPVFSILAVYSIKQLANKYLYTFLIIVIVLISITSIGYRGIANAKFIPFILGKETKGQYLTTHLNFSFGDFYDTDGYFKSHLKSTDTVLLYGFHNLYYADFPFIDSSWVKKGDKFNYIAVQDSVLPEKFNNWQQIYYNPITKVKLYSLGGQEWVY